METVHDHKAGGSKIHARLRDELQRGRLWVRNDEHWAVMRTHRTELVCPQLGCSVPIEPVDMQGTRFLRNKRGWKDACDHWQETTTDAEPGGGPMSPRHVWHRDRLVRICESLGMEAIPEHPPTHADVYIPITQYALEIQLRDTDFIGRIQARASRGANTLWLLPPDISGKAVEDALFRLPSARLNVYDARVPPRARGNHPFAPWNDSKQLNRHARLEVYATVYVACDEAPYLRRRKMDCRQFLREVLAGQRVWVPENTDGVPTKKRGRGRVAGWVKPDEVQNAREEQRADQARPVTTAQSAQGEATATRRPPNVGAPKDTVLGAAPGPCMPVARSPESVGTVPPSAQLHDASTEPEQRDGPPVADAPTRADGPPSTPNAESAYGDTAGAPQKSRMQAKRPTRQPLWRRLFRRT